MLSRRAILAALLRAQGLPPASAVSSSTVTAADMRATWSWRSLIWSSCGRAIIAPRAMTASTSHTQRLSGRRGSPVPERAPARAASAAAAGTRHAHAARSAAARSGSSRLRAGWAGPSRNQSSRYAGPASSPPTAPATAVSTAPSRRRSPGVAPAVTSAELRRSRRALPEETACQARTRAVPATKRTAVATPIRVSALVTMLEYRGSKLRVMVGSALSRGGSAVAGTRNSARVTRTSPPAAAVPPATSAARVREARTPGAASRRTVAGLMTAPPGGR